MTKKKCKYYMIPILYCKMHENAHISEINTIPSEFLIISIKKNTILSIHDLFSIVYCLCVLAYNKKYI